MAETNGVSDIQKQIEKLQAGQQRIDQRMKHRRQLDASDKTRRRTVGEQIRRLELMQCLGKPGGVQLRFRSDGKSARLNDKRGRLTKVNRTRGDVDFDGESLPWSILLENLQPAGQLQGMVMNLG